MRFWGFWVLATWALVTAQSPAPSAHLALGLAVVAAALLVALAVAGGSVLPSAPAGGAGQVRPRARTQRIARLLDPDAAGRPRPRAPSAYPAAAW
jgi:Family of unknown function (DUF6412)